MAEPEEEQGGGKSYWMGWVKPLLIIRQNTIPSRPKGDGFGRRRNWVGGEKIAWGGLT